MARSGAGPLGWLRRSRVGLALASRLGAGYIRFCHATTRWQVEGKAGFDAAAAAGPVIAANWHGRLLLLPPWGPPGRETVAMISNNRDGDLIAGVVARFGVTAVRGSTFDRGKRRDKGGREAYRTGIAALARGAILAITPDGPRGPRMRAEIGVAQLAADSGAPVIPIAYSVSRGRQLGSWDRFLLAFPFGRGALICGAPMRAPNPADAAGLETFRAEVEAALIAVTDRADSLCGQPRVEPAQAERKIPGAHPG